MATTKTRLQIEAEEALAYYQGTTWQDWVPQPGSAGTTSGLSDAAWSDLTVQNALNAPEGTYSASQIQDIINAANLKGAQGPEALGTGNQDQYIGAAQDALTWANGNPNGHKMSLFDKLMYDVMPIVIGVATGGQMLGLWSLGAAAGVGAAAGAGAGSVAAGTAAAGAAGAGATAAGTAGTLGGLSGIGIAGGAPAIVSIGAPAAAGIGAGTVAAGAAGLAGLGGLMSGGSPAPTSPQKAPDYTGEPSPQPGPASFQPVPEGPIPSVTIGAPTPPPLGLGEIAAGIGGAGALAGAVSGGSAPPPEGPIQSVTIGPPTTPTPYAPPEAPLWNAAGGLASLLSTNPQALQTLPQVNAPPQPPAAPTPPLYSMPNSEVAGPPLPIPAFGVPNVTPPAQTTPTSPTTPKPPGSGSSNPLTGLGDILGGLLGGNVDRIKANQDADWWKSQIDTLMGMYKPGTPEANLMRQQMEAKDAATGRRSQYGIRETDLAAKLAEKRSGIMTSAGYQNMANAYRQRSSQDLSGLFGAMGANGGMGSTISGIISGLGGLFGGK